MGRGFPLPVSLLPALFVALICTKSALSLKCYECNSATDPDCAESPPPQKYLTECTQDGMDDAHLQTDLQDAVILNPVPPPVLPDIPPSPAPEDIPPSPAPEDIPPSPALEDILPSPALEDIPPSPVPEGIPPSPVPEDIPPSPVPEDIPPTHTPEDISEGSAPPLQPVLVGHQKDDSAPLPVATPTASPPFHQEDEDSTLNFNRTARDAENAAPPLAPEVHEGLPVLKEASYCRKTIYHIPAQDNGINSTLPKSQRILRSCGWIPEDKPKDKSGCKMIGKEGVHMEQCVCSNEEGCNSGNHFVSFTAQNLLVLATMTVGYFYVL